eukprot:gnl/MRDRNA2_/MRDRNA2_97404_c0_seq1.p1 gnl/MRDRNA2_/MRDRNA2_97404_c0~~gnl/MRDRNA2_/MRDRNA2_97404_c0_seq1.p1  ORF type:complete len:234 (+),score=37.61 gnl/MRDRNA2_/MRDRNA2_97404_c0_seq1:70-771(+)
MVPAPRCAPPMGSARAPFSTEEVPAPRCAPSMGSARVSFSADEVKPPPSRESQRGSDGVPSPNKARVRQSIEQAISNAESEMAIKKPPHPGFSKSGTGGYSKPGENVRAQTPSHELSENEVEVALGNLALKNHQAVDTANLIFEAATKKLHKSKLSEIYSNPNLILSGRIGAPGDFQSDSVLRSFSKVWNTPEFERAVELLCAGNGLKRARWQCNEGDFGQSEDFRFTLQWGA